MAHGAAASPTPSQLRCAIYTRKSVVQGLEQDFNSLDAQREAAEAYIKSQSHQGWVCVPDRYDDGGFSGATLERPALKRLFADIEAKKIDCVLVYKVDRLSRSLLDFTKLVDFLDQHGATFVSITQQFQTTTSMGRLTLNVLLSFAQFEREMISERTRDKMSAARRKGKWVGGFPILGYDIDSEGGRLKTNPKEAQRVAEIFRLYLRHRSFGKVLRELDRRGWRTKRWTTRKGRVRGGNRFSKSTLSHLLKHRYYNGQVCYRGEVYPGEHDALVEPKMFDQVQRCLRRAGRVCRPRQRSGALLQGLLECGACKARMTPTYTVRRGRWYRYYLCTRAQRDGSEVCPVPSIPSRRVEDRVLDALRALGRDQEHVSLAGGGVPNGIAQTRSLCAELDSSWDGLAPDERRAALGRVLQSVVYDARREMLLLVLGSASDASASPRQAEGGDEAALLKVRCPLKRISRNGQADGSRNGGIRAVSGAIPRVARLMALAVHFEALLSESVVESFADLARLGHVTRARISQIMNLGLLAPDLQEFVLCLPRTRKGRATVTERMLRRVTAHACWADQREALAEVLAQRRTR